MAYEQPLWLVYFISKSSYTGVIKSRIEKDRIANMEVFIERHIGNACVGQ